MNKQINRKLQQVYRKCDMCGGVIINRFSHSENPLDDNVTTGYVTTYKGYKVRVTFTKIIEEEMQRKRKAVARIIFNNGQRNGKLCPLSRQGLRLSSLKPGLGFLQKNLHPSFRYASQN